TSSARSPCTACQPEFRTTNSRYSPGSNSPTKALCFHTGNSRVSGMETNARISPEEASAALAMARDSRARAAWAGFPAWYWLGRAAGFGGAAYLILRPVSWELAVMAVIAVSLVALTRAASRVRGAAGVALADAAHPAGRAGEPFGWRASGAGDARRGV